jgi:hypothetical protein
MFQLWLRKDHRFLLHEFVTEKHVMYRFLNGGLHQVDAQQAMLMAHLHLSQGEGCIRCLGEQRIAHIHPFFVC